MLARRRKPQISRPLEDLATRRQRQAIEGPQAMKEYRQAQQAYTKDCGAGGTPQRSANYTAKGTAEPARC
jgi:hypothetical protein